MESVLGEPGFRRGSRRVALGVVPRTKLSGGGSHSCPFGNGCMNFIGLLDARLGSSPRLFGETVVGGFPGQWPSCIFRPFFQRVRRKPNEHRQKHRKVVGR
jgi:hypothetical protein